MIQTSRIQLICGSARNTGLPDESVHCVVTSPPYYGLRAYQGTPAEVWPPQEGQGEMCAEGEHEWGGESVACLRGSAGESKSLEGPQSGGRVTELSTGQFCKRCNAWYGTLGNEPTPQLYAWHMVLVFREVKRVLRSDGLLWLNLGDSFAGSGQGLMADDSHATGAKQATNRGSVNGLHGLRGVPTGNGYKPKDLMGIPSMVSDALLADGWYRRSAFPWLKPNGMPGSQQDRPTVSNEWLFQFSKAPHYYYDQQSVALPSKAPNDDRKARSSESQKRMPTFEVDGMRPGSATYPTRFRRTSDWYFESIDETIDELEQYIMHLKAVRKGGLLLSPDGEPLADIASTASYKGAHFAVFPPKMITPLVLASTSRWGCCAACGAPHERVAKKSSFGASEQRPDNEMAGRSGNGLDRARAGWSMSTTLGWQPTCKCGCAEVGKCVVLDIFGGSGTTAEVALKNGLAAVLVDSNPDYIKQQQERLSKLVSMDELRANTVDVNQVDIVLDIEPLDEQLPLPLAA